MVAKRIELEVVSCQECPYAHFYLHRHGGGHPECGGFEPVETKSYCQKKGRWLNPADSGLFYMIDAGIEAYRGQIYFMKIPDFCPLPKKGNKKVTEGSRVLEKLNEYSDHLIQNYTEIRKQKLKKAKERYQKMLKQERAEEMNQEDDEQPVIVNANME